MADRLQKGLSKNRELRFFTAEITETAEQGRKIHNLSPVKTVIFGKLLCAGLLFASDLKERHHLLTIKTFFKNPEDYLIITANNQGRVKGYPHLTFQEEDLAADLSDPVNHNREVKELIKTLLKDGLFTVIKDIGLKNPYHGSSALITGEIARDITYYLTVSEQNPSVVGLSVVLNDDGSVKRAVGFMVQLLPVAGETTIELLEQNIRKLPEIIDLLEMGYSIEQILSEMVLKGLDYEITRESGADYYCDCSLERFEKGLLLLSKDELLEIKRGYETIPLQCHYCNKRYEVKAETIERILETVQKKQGTKKE